MKVRNVPTFVNVAQSCMSVVRLLIYPPNLDHVEGMETQYLYKKVNFHDTRTSTKVAPFIIFTYIKSRFLLRNPSRQRPQFVQ